MNNRVKYRLKETELTGLTGCPTNVDDYVEWFNRNFTFARARVLRDARGLKFVDFEYGK